MQRLGHETGHPELTGPFGEPGEQHRAQSSALPTVGDHERHLGVRPAADPVEPGHGDDLTVGDRDDGLPIDVVDVGEAMELVGAELGMDGEEAPPGRLR